MATQYTSILKLALPVTGELSGTWGDVVNNNITSMIEQAIAGLSTINTWTANAHTLTVADGTTSESRCAMLVAATGTGGTALTAAGEIICPAASKLYVLKNGAAYAVTLKTAAGTGVAVPAGDTAFLFCDGTNVNACVTTIVNGHISGNLTVDGNTTLGDANTDTVTVTAQFASDLLPSTDNARDLGSTAKSWRTLYCDTSVLVGNLSLAGNTLSSTDTNGNIVIAPNGTGDVQLDADTVRVGDSNANATITSNGTGDLILNTNAGTNSGSITIEDGVNGNIIIAPNGTGQVQITNAALDLTTIEVSNINAKDGTAAITIADSTGAVGISTAVTMSATTQNIALGTSQTTGTFTVGGASQTGALTLDQSTKTHTLNLGTGATESGLTKTINLGTGGVSTSTTAINIGSANGTTTTVSGAFVANGGAVFNENGADVDFRVEGDTDASLIFADASTDRVGIGTNTPGVKLDIAGNATVQNGVLTVGKDTVYDAFINSPESMYFNVDSDANSSGNKFTWGTDRTGNTGGTTWMTLDSSGNLGLGTATTTNGRLNVQAGTAATGNSAFFSNPDGTYNPYLQIQHSSAGVKLFNGSSFGAASNNLIFGNAGTSETMRIDGSGNVGIGTDAPAYKLDVVGNAQIRGGLNLLLNNGSNNAAAAIWNPGSSGVGEIAFGYGAEWMRLSNGNLGVGTNSPTSKFAVSNGTNRLEVAPGASNVVLQALNEARTATTELLSAGSILTYWTGAAGSQAEKMRLDSSGNLGLGVTPSPWSSPFKAFEGGDSDNQEYMAFQTNANAMKLGVNHFYLGSNYVYKFTGAASRYDINDTSFIWNLATSGAGNTATITNGVSYTIITSGNQTDFGAANNNVGTSFTANASGTLSSGTVSQNISFTQAMTLNASGNLAIGDTNASATGFDTGVARLFVVAPNSNTGAAIAAVADSSGRGYLLADQTKTYIGSLTITAADGFSVGSNTANTPLRFTTGATERARITSGGYFKASNDGTYYGSTGSQHELRNTANGEWVVRAVSASATDPNGMEIRYSAATPNGTANRFLYCLDATALRAEIRSNGGLANYQSNNVDLSDIRTKTDINPLASYWSKIAALEIVSYKYKDQTHDDLNIGVIAQQVEQVAPEFVDADGFGETPEDGVPLKTIYNKDLTFAAIKALQEAMARIEKLEAEVAALKGV